MPIEGWFILKFRFNKSYSLALSLSAVGFIFSSLA